MSTSTSEATSEEKYSKIDQAKEKADQLDSLLQQLKSLQDLKDNLTCCVCWDPLRPGERGIEQ